MKKIVLLLAAACTFVLASAEDKPYHFKPYGFIRNYAFFDTRATKSLAEDVFFFVPLDKKMVNGNDVNAVSSFNYQAITTRLGLDILGYQVGSTKINGKIEADFYCLNSNGNTGTLRMRQAYVDLLWDELGKNGNTDLSLRIGQSWHPLAADMPNMINLETGAPFSPFNRSAQLMFNATFNKKLTFTAGILEQLQYRSAGPAGSTNKYQRHAIPEVYAGVSYKNGGFLGRVGASMLSIRPQYGYDATTGKKYDEWFTTFNPFVFLQYTKGRFQVKAKSTYAQSGEHMQLNGGYAVCGTKADGISHEYTPLTSTVNFISAQYGKKLQVLGMVGYMKSLGSYKDITGPVYFSGNGFQAIEQMFRVTPTLLYNLGKMQFGIEYDWTSCRYGDKFGSKGIPTDNLHWVTNHRVLVMAKFNW
jgi:hypothetical protein